MTRLGNEDIRTNYIRTLYAGEDELLVNIREHCVQINRDWQVGAEEGKLLQVLLQMHGAKKVVELGTLLGYSAIWMARGLPEGGMLYTCERDVKHAEIARGYFARSDVAKKITLLEGDGHASLKSISDKGPFDAIFIDAEKPGYNAYLDWAETNVRSGGLIIADNTFLFGTVYLDSPGEEAPNTWKAMKQFNERLADKSKFNAIIVPTVEGLSVAVKK